MNLNEKMWTLLKPEEGVQHTIQFGPAAKNKIQVPDPMIEFAQRLVARHNNDLAEIAVAPSLNVTVVSKAPSAANELAAAVEKLITEWAIKEKRAGGLLSR